LRGSEEEDIPIALSAEKASNVEVGSCDSSMRAGVSSRSFEAIDELI